MLLIPGGRGTGRPGSYGHTYGGPNQSVGRLGDSRPPIGRYSLSVDKVGFRHYVQTGFTLTTGQGLELNVTLDLGPLTETVNVPSQEPLVDSQEHRRSVSRQPPRHP